MKNLIVFVLFTVTISCTEKEKANLIKIETYRMSPGIHLPVPVGDSWIDSTALAFKTTDPEKLKHFFDLIKDLKSSNDCSEFSTIRMRAVLTYENQISENLDFNGYHIRYLDRCYDDHSLLRRFLIGN